jgi:hypothetical protein
MQEQHAKIGNVFVLKVQKLSNKLVYQLMKKFVPHLVEVVQKRKNVQVEVSAERVGAFALIHQWLLPVDFVFKLNLVQLFHLHKLLALNLAQIDQFNNLQYFHQPAKLLLELHVDHWIFVLEVQLVLIVLVYAQLECNLINKQPDVKNLMQINLQQLELQELLQEMNI